MSNYSDKNKLYTLIRCLPESTFKTQLRTEIDSLRQQLAAAQSRIEELEGIQFVNRNAIRLQKEKVAQAVAACKLKDAALAESEQDRLQQIDAKTQFMRELNAVEEKLIDAIAACKLKDDVISMVRDNYFLYEHHEQLSEEALAIQPDDAALKAWLGEPLGYADINGVGFRAPLYSPKGMK